MDNLEEVIFAGEGDVGLFESSASFAEDCFGSVDKDIADGGITEELFEWSESEGFVHDFADEGFSFGGGEELVGLAAEFFGSGADFGSEFGIGASAYCGEVEAADESSVEVAASGVIDFSDGLCGDWWLFAARCEGFDGSESGIRESRGGVLEHGQPRISGERWRRRDDRGSSHERESDILWGVGGSCFFGGKKNNRAGCSFQSADDPVGDHLPAAV